MEKPDKKATEQKILEAAENVFSRNGYAATRTREIAEMAGCNVSLVHYYFRTKENLFIRIFQEKLTWLLEFMSQLINNSEISFEDKLIHFIDAHFEMVHQNPSIPLMLLNETNLNPGLIEQVKKINFSQQMILLGRLEVELETCIKEGTIKPIKLRDLLLHIISLNISVFHLAPLHKTLWNIHEDEMEFIYQERKKEHIRFILSALKP